MGKQIFFYFLILTLAGVSFLSRADAAEKITYNKFLSERETRLIYTFLSIEQPNTLDIAATDLNKDGLNEYIVKDKNCTPKQGCTFKIIAQNSEELIALTEIKALRLMLGDSYANGVRNLLAFQSPENDFKHHVYSWNPEQSRYRLLK